MVSLIEILTVVVWIVKPASTQNSVRNAAFDD